ncbi:hypothetical protein JOB18_045823 [Solea senegalensis]|uniref:Uncharacterized protein n=1 Tax=Solea senegalensis TaxID=28829 RepID=A0AAV6STS2_SOLSE|nr:hypothetical protein JOB18_045823 [Solea senegalensis]
MLGRLARARTDSLETRSCHLIFRIEFLLLEKLQPFHVTPIHHPQPRAVKDGGENDGSEHHDFSIEIEVVIQKDKFGEPPEGCVCGTNPVVYIFVHSTFVGQIASQEIESFHGLKDFTTESYVTGVWRGETRGSLRQELSLPSVLAKLDTKGRVRKLLDHGPKVEGKEGVGQNTALLQTSGDREGVRHGVLGHYTASHPVVKGLYKVREVVRTAENETSQGCPHRWSWNTFSRSKKMKKSRCRCSRDFFCSNWAQNIMSVVP